MYIGLGLVIIGGLILLFRHLKVKKTKEDETEDKLNIKVEHLLKECYEQLNIPIDALKIDIISTKYHTNKKGEHKFANQNLFIPINEETSWFIEEDSLFIADLISVIKIPLNSIKALKEIDKRILLRQWNKEESFNSEKYKSYKIKPQNAGLFLIAKTYYSLEFNVDNEEYNILVPKYDLNNLLKLLPLKIEV